jgi:hypothetical protein
VKVINYERMRVSRKRDGPVSLLRSWFFDANRILLSIPLLPLSNDVVFIYSWVLGRGTIH